MQPSRENLKVIRFENEMLPKWAQLLDFAAQLLQVSKTTREWFSRFTNSAGVDDARIIISGCETLLTAIRQQKTTLIRELLKGTHGDNQAAQIVAAWEYSLETMIQESRSRKTCSWRIAESDTKDEGDFGDGDIALRRV